MLSTRLSTASGPLASAVSRGCLQQLLCRSLYASGATDRSPTACHSMQSTAGPGQQSGTQTTPGHEVVGSMNFLEQAGIGPLSQEPMVPAPAPRVIVISGPSGVGKDAVIKRLQERCSDLYFVVTATSRAMRHGEVEGKDYFFVSKETFESWIQQGQLLEHAVVYGEYKGIPRHQVDTALQRGSDVVLRIDVQGAATVRRLMPEVVSVFIVAETEAQLVARLTSRKTEPLDKLITRVKTAREEISHIKDFDYVVVNKDGQLDECVGQLCAIIRAENLRVRR